MGGGGERAVVCVDETKVLVFIDFRGPDHAKRRLVYFPLEKLTSTHLAATGLAKRGSWMRKFSRVCGNLRPLILNALVAYISCHSWSLIWFVRI